MARGHRSASRPRHYRLGLAAIAAAGALLYANALRAPFVFDDHRNLLENPSIRWKSLSLENLARASFASPSLRPVANLSFALNYYLGGEAPEGYHAVNVLVHVANAALVYALARATLVRLAALPGQAGPRLSPGAIGGLSLVSGLLFAAHPLQTNCVTYVVQRMTSLATLFTLLALLLYARGRESAPGAGRRARLAGAGAAGLLALGSKEIAVTLPLAAWLYEWFFLRDLDRGFARRSLLRLGIPLAALGAGLYLFFFWGPDWGYARRDFTLGERLLTQLRVVVIYLSLIAFPHPARLNLLHDVGISRSLLDPPTTLACGLLLAALLAGGVGLARRFRLLSFGILWFFLQLALESTVLPLEMIYEHRTYLPLVGVALALPWLGWAALGSRPRLAIALAALTLAALATGTWLRNQAWRDPVALWSDVVAKSPNSARARADLCASLAMAGRSREAIAACEEALRVDPGEPRAHANLGLLYGRLGRYAKAIHHYSSVLRQRPDDADAHTSLGAVLAQQGDRARALEELSRALELDPRSARAQRNLGLLLVREGRLEQARPHLELALELEPDHPAARAIRERLAPEGAGAQAR